MTAADRSQGVGTPAQPAPAVVPPLRSPHADWREADWRAICESIPHMVWLADLDGRSVYFNEQGLAYVGLPFEEVTWAELVHPDDLAGVRLAWASAVREQRLFEADYRLRRCDGLYRWHACRSSPVHGDDGRVVRWLGTATDITERKAMEGEVRSAERQAAQALNLLATLQEAAPVGFGFVDRDLRIVRLNDVIRRFASQPDDIHMGRTVADVVPEHWEAMEPLYRGVLDAGESVVNVPFLRPGPDAGEPPSEWLASLYPVRVDEEIVGVGLVVVDVTEEVQAERLRAAVMSQVSEGVYVQDGQGRLTYMNGAASRMLGWGEEELRGRSMHDVVHPHRVAGAPVSLTDCPLCTPGEGQRHRRGGGEAFTRKDGTRFSVAYSTLPLGIGNESDGVSVVFHDLTPPGEAPSQIRVLLVTDSTSEGHLSTILCSDAGFDVVSSATTWASAVDQTRHLAPEVVVVDAALAGANWKPTVHRILAELPAAVLLLLAATDDESWAASAIEAGCAGAVARTRAWVDLPAAVRAAHDGEVKITHAQLQEVITAARDRRPTGGIHDLTGREHEVLVCMTQGLSNAQAAERLGVTVNTVRNHVQRILYKFDVHSRLEAVVLATRDGPLTVPP